MNSDPIERLSQANPVPGEMSPLSIEYVRRRLPDAVERPRRDPARHRIATGKRSAASGWAGWLAPSLAIVVTGAVVVFAVISLGGRHAAVSAGQSKGRTAPPTHIKPLGHHASSPQLGGRPGVAVRPCRSGMRAGVLPVWARAGFSDPRPREEYVVGRRDRIAAILFSTGDYLDSPPSTGHSNKILWVPRVRTGAGGALAIHAQLMRGTRRVGMPVKRTVIGGPGPSIINLPTAGCWRLTLRWSGWTDQLDLEYMHPAE